MTIQEPIQLAVLAGGSTSSILTNSQFTTAVPRFPPAAKEEEVDRQMERRDKLLERLVLPDFKPVDEKSFEDWVNKAARSVMKHRVCGQIFQEACEAVSNEDLAAMIGSYPATADHEELVRQVAKELFPFQYYIKDVEEQLFRG